MKLPAVAIAVAFACGILLGQSHFFSSRAGLPVFLLIIGTAVCVLLVLGLALSWRNHLWSAASAALVTWISLGLLAACLAEQPLPPEHILTRFAAQQISQRTPLRWHGILRSEPARLP